MADRFFSVIEKAIFCKNLVIKLKIKKTSKMFFKKKIFFGIIALFFTNFCYMLSKNPEKKPEVWVGFKGVSSQDPDVVCLKKALDKKLVQGVVLFSRNIENPQQLKRLIAFLKKNNPNVTVALDQEGGKVMRLTLAKGFQSGNMLALSDYQTLDQVVRVHELAAKEMRDLGITMVFGPVVDVNVNPECPVIGKLGRSFSSDVEKVTQYAQSVINTYARYALKACLKHAPGHGNSMADSHLGVTDITSTWSDAELIPFIQCAKTIPGIAIMLGHLMHRDLDSDYPASFSKKTICWMNQKMHDSNVNKKPFYIADGYEMHAVFDNYSAKEVIELGGRSGIDAMLFFCNHEYYPQGYSLQDFLKEKLGIIVSIDSGTQMVHRSSSSDSTDRDSYRISTKNQVED